MAMTQSRRWPTAVLAGAALVLTGCGASTPAATSPTAASPAPSGASTEPGEPGRIAVTLTDAMAA